jgi:hypothetical protein
VLPKFECEVCPINTYSKGGNSKCLPCSGNKLTTNFKPGQTECQSTDLECAPGEEIDDGDAITKEKLCIPCKQNTFSKGGINVKCKKCPRHKPTTNFKDAQTECVSTDIICDPGKGINDGDGIEIEKKMY